MRLRLLSTIPVVLALAACASVPPSSDASSTPAKEAPVQPSPSSPSTATASPQVGTPELTPQQVADRLLALIDSLHTRQDITPETMQRFMGTPIYPDPREPGEFGTGAFVSPDWSYSLDVTEARPDHPVVLLFDYYTPYRNRDETDLTPISTPGFEYYRQRLVEMGFSARDTGSLQPNHGWGFEWYFIRGNVGVAVIRYDALGVRPFVPSQAVQFIYINVHDHPIPAF